MRILIRRTAFAFLAIVAVTLLAFTNATSALAGKALMVGGLAAGNLHDVIMSNVLSGQFSNDQRVSVDWPAQAKPYTGANDLTLGQSITIGTDNLRAALAAAAATGEHVTIVGMSAGALVVDEVLRELASAGNAPAKSQLSIVVIADSSRQNVINDTKYNAEYDYTYRPPPDTIYDTVVVTGEYDGMADFPDRWWNLLAIANAFAGSIVVHVPVMFADLATVPDANITTTVNSVGGVTTHYLVPTNTLPLVQLLPFLAPYEAALKASIDQGYTRNDATPANSAAVDTTSLRTTGALVPAAQEVNAEVAPQATVDTNAEAIDPVDTNAEASDPVDTNAEAIDPVDTNAEAIDPVDTNAEAIADLQDSDPASVPVAEVANEAPISANPQPTVTGADSVQTPSDKVESASGATIQEPRKRVKRSEAAGPAATQSSRPNRITDGNKVSPAATAKAPRATHSTLGGQSEGKGSAVRQAAASDTSSPSRATATVSSGESSSASGGDSDSD